MCTVSWLHRTDGYELFFNRDELRTRQPAQPPALHERDGVRWLAPTDGNHGGTWLGVNQYGLTLGLLNRYQDPFDRARPYDSRGWLVRDLLPCYDDQAVAQNLAQLDLARFPPFTLLLLTPRQARIAHWNGDKLWWESDADACRPLSSSSYHTPEVIAARREHFRHITERQTLTPALLDQFHRSHVPQPGPLSVCMHRDDAQTVSFSRISVERDKAVFSYQAGPPCTDKESVTVDLPRQGRVSWDQADLGKFRATLSSLDLTAPSAVVVFKCPRCGETLLWNTEKCRYCGTEVSELEALPSALYETIIAQACSWANNLRAIQGAALLILAINWGMHLIDIHRVFPVTPLLLSALYCLGPIIWNLRYGGLRVADEEFTQLQKKMRRGLHLWLAFIALQVLVAYFTW